MLICSYRVELGKTNKTFLHLRLLCYLPYHIALLFGSFFCLFLRSFTIRENLHWVQICDWITYFNLNNYLSAILKQSQAHFVTSQCVWHAQHLYGHINDGIVSYTQVLVGLWIWTQVSHIQNYNLRMEQHPFLKAFKRCIFLYIYSLNQVLTVKMQIFPVSALLHIIIDPAYLTHNYIFQPIFHTHVFHACQVSWFFIPTCWHPCHIQVSHFNMCEEW